MGARYESEGFKSGPLKLEVCVYRTKVMSWLHSCCKAKQTKPANQRKRMPVRLEGGWAWGCNRRNTCSYAYTNHQVSSWYVLYL